MAKKKAQPGKKAVKGASKKQPPASKRAQIRIDLEPTAKAAPTKEQIRRLKALLKNDVLTWLKSDLKSDVASPICVGEDWPVLCDGDDEEDR